MTLTQRVKSAAEALLALDKTTSHAAARHRHEPPARATGWLADAADEPQLVALSIATATVGLATGRRDLTRGGLRMLASLTLAIGVKSLLKNSVDRSRPKHALDTGEERFEPGTSDDHQQQSFASGHTAGAMAVTRAAAHEVEGVALPGTAVTIAVAAALPVAGNHYISDVLAGAAIGWAAEALVGLVFRRWTWGVEPEGSPANH